MHRSLSVLIAVCLLIAAFMPRTIAAEPAPAGLAAKSRDTETITRLLDRPDGRVPVIVRYRSALIDTQLQGNLVREEAARAAMLERRTLLLASLFGLRDNLAAVRAAASGRVRTTDQAPYILAEATALEIARIAAHPFVDLVEIDRGLELSEDSEALDRGLVAARIRLVGKDPTNFDTFRAFSPIDAGIDGDCCAPSPNPTAVAIIDSGVDPKHVFLAGRVLPGACFSTSGLTVVRGVLVKAESLCSATSSAAIKTGGPCTLPMARSACGHGTSVAGVAAGGRFAASSLERPKSGAAPDARLVPVQVLTGMSAEDCQAVRAAKPEPRECYLLRVSDVILALDWLLGMADGNGFHDAKSGRSIPLVAVNLSLGGLLVSAECPGTAYQDYAEQFARRHIYIFGAAGNDSERTRAVSPACAPDVIGVTAYKPADFFSDDALLDDANLAPFIDVAAPGIAYTSNFDPLQPGNHSLFGIRKGTSLATPLVAGAYAAFRSAVPLISGYPPDPSYLFGSRVLKDERKEGRYAIPKLDLLGALDSAGHQPSFWITGSEDDPVWLPVAGVFPARSLKVGSSPRARFAFVDVPPWLTLDHPAGWTNAEGTEVAVVIHPAAAGLVPGARIATEITAFAPAGASTSAVVDAAIPAFEGSVSVHTIDADGAVGDYLSAIEIPWKPVPGQISIESDRPWVRVTQTGPDVVEVEIPAASIASLPPGLTTATIRIRNASWPRQRETIQRVIHIYRSPVGLASIAFDGRFSGPRGGPFSSTKLDMWLNDVSRSCRAWRISGLPVWLTAAKTSGAIASPDDDSSPPCDRGSASVTLTPNIFAGFLASGDHDAIITIRVAGVVFVRPVVLTIGPDGNSPPPSLSVEASGPLNFTVSPDGTVTPKSVSLTLTAGESPVDWGIQSRHLTTSPSGGRLLSGQSRTVSVVPSAGFRNGPIGTFTGELAINAVNDDHEHVLVYSVKRLPDPAALELSKWRGCSPRPCPSFGQPEFIQELGQPGQAFQMSFTVKAPTTTPVNFLITGIPPWLSVTPQMGAVSSTRPVTVVVRSSPKQMALLSKSDFTHDAYHAFGNYLGVSLSVLANLRHGILQDAGSRTFLLRELGDDPDLEANGPTMHDHFVTEGTGVSIGAVQSHTVKMVKGSAYVAMVGGFNYVDYRLYPIDPRLEVQWEDGNGTDLVPLEEGKSLTLYVAPRSGADALKQMKQGVYSLGFMVVDAENLCNFCRTATVILSERLFIISKTVPRLWIDTKYFDGRIDLAVDRTTGKVYGDSLLAQSLGPTLTIAVEDTPTWMTAPKIETVRSNPPTKLAFEPNELAKSLPIGVYRKRILLKNKVNNLGNRSVMVELTVY